VELEVEEDAIATIGHRPHQLGAFGREETASDLESADGAAQHVRQRTSLLARFDVERD
jgi:hypothetical protein